MKTHVLDIEKLLNREIAFAALSIKPVDSEVELLKKPKPSLRFYDKLAPLSLSVPAKNIRITSNPKMDRVLYKVINDDIPASIAIVKLYLSGIDVYTIQRALSLGLIGRRKSRRLVPTRWAITAVDRSISRAFLVELYGRDTIDHSELYYVEYLGNRFWILLLPGKYEILWIEVWHPSTIFTQQAKEPVVVINRERISGTPDYMDGGFEAAKMSILENLYKRRRQAKVVIVREITPRYYVSVGNWHIRESVREALQRNLIAKNITIRETHDVIANTSKIAAKAFIEALKSKDSSLDRFFLNQGDLP